MFGALKRGRFRSLASLILVVNVVGELQQKRTLAASRGFLAAARLSCFMWNYAHELITVDSLYRFRDIGAEKLENSGFLTDLSAFPHTTRQNLRMKQFCRT